MNKTKARWSFRKCRAYLRGMQIMNVDSYSRSIEQGILPDGFPIEPYKKWPYEFVNWQDYLGTKNEILLPFNELTVFSRSLGISKRSDYFNIFKINKFSCVIPYGVTSRPDIDYHQFSDWNYYLVGKVFVNKDIFLQFIDDLDIVSYDGWFSYMRNMKNDPVDVENFAFPVFPNIFYGEDILK